MTPSEERRGPRRAPRTARARSLRRRIRRACSQGLARLATIVVPHLYMAYMRLVWATSRIEGRDFVALNRWAADYRGVVCLLWHEEVFTVAYGYYWLGIRIHTLASLGESGELITRMLELCNAVVFRGGSTTGRSRRRDGAVADLVDHMQTTDRVTLGLTVDGSKGPPYRMKGGGVVVARDSDRPIALVRTWYKRCLRLNTWDRMALPLPFNRIRYYLRGPYFVPERARTPDGLEAFRRELEDALIDLAVESYTDMGQPPPAHLRHADGDALRRARQGDRSTYGA